jgi:hypothetical protein
MYTMPFNHLKAKVTTGQGDCSIFVGLPDEHGARHLQTLRDSGLFKVSIKPMGHFDPKRAYICVVGMYHDRNTRTKPVIAEIFEVFTPNELDVLRNLDRVTDLVRIYFRDRLNYEEEGIYYCTLKHELDDILPNDIYYHSNNNYITHPEVLSAN